MTLRELHESWVKTGYPSRTEIRKAIEGLLAEESKSADNKGNDKGLVEEIKGFADWLDKAATRIGLERMDYHSKVTYENIAGKLREILVKFREAK